MPLLFLGEFVDNLILFDEAELPPRHIFQIDRVVFQLVDFLPQSSIRFAQLLILGQDSIQLLGNPVVFQDTVRSEYGPRANHSDNEYAVQQYFLAVSL